MPQKSSPQFLHRHSIRLKEYDYSQAGGYFITICTHERNVLFGTIFDGNICLNDYGEIARVEWKNTASYRDEVELGEFVIMPDHFHGILFILAGRGTARRAPTDGQFGKPVAGAIPTIVRSFKSAVTRAINIQRGTPGAPVWQRNYWEHVIRDDEELREITRYILTNPARLTR